MIEIKRSGECACIVENDASIVIVHADEIPAVIRELQRIYEEVKHEEGESNSMMHDPPIPF